MPADRLIGVPGEGFKLAMRTLDIFRASVAAAALGFVLSLVPAYLGHRRLTFRSTGPKASEVPRFLATNLLCFGLTLACTHFFGATLGLPTLAALALTSVFVPALNFVLMACVVFVRRKGAGARG